MGQIGVTIMPFPRIFIGIPCYRLDGKRSERRLAISQMSGTPIKKQLIGLVFLLFICPSMPLGASDGGTYHVPSGQSEFRLSGQLAWSCCGNPLIRNKQMACRLSRSDGATLSCSSSTDADARYWFQLDFGPNACGTYRVTLGFAGISTDVLAYTVVHWKSCPTAPSSSSSETTESPKLFIVSGYNQTGIVGEPLAEPFVVRVRDRDNKPLEGVRVNFTVLTGGGSLSTTTAITDQDGLAKSTLTLGDEPGTNTVEVRTEGVSKVVTFSAEATLPPPPPTRLSSISGENQEGLTGESLATPFTVQVRDQHGDPMEGVTVTFAVTAGDGSLSTTTATTDSDGQAKTILTLGTDPGTVTVEASVEGISQAVTFNAEAALPPPIPMTLSIVSGENQEGLTGEPLANPFIVQVHDQYGNPMAGVPVTFTVSETDGLLTDATVITNTNGEAESTLTFGTEPGAYTVQASVEGIAQTVTFNAIAELLEFNLSLSTGLNLIHLPLRVRAVDGMSTTIQSVSELYNQLGGASTVNYLITHDSHTQTWHSYFGDADRGTPADRGLTADMGIIAGMKAPTSIRLGGDALGTGGSSTITLNQGLNLVGLPLRDSRITRVSDLFTLDGIGGNTLVIILRDGGGFQSVGRAGDPGDIEIAGGQSFIMTAQQAAMVEISGEAWTNVSGTAASPPVTRKGIEVGNITPVLALKGIVVDEGVALNKPDLRVTVKNLSTGRVVTGITRDEGTGYRLTVVDIETGRAATVGDIFEVSAHSAHPSVGVQPLWYMVTAEDMKRGLIQVPELVAYKIPVETKLLRNYPNPFNPETWIPYRLAEDAFVTLTIYDGTGGVVRTLDVGHRIAAAYENRSGAIYWDGRNGLGEQVASGVYFYTLTAGDYSATRRMLILK